jgi:hypothetical protein
MRNTNKSLWSQEYIWRKLGNYMEKYQKNLRNGQKNDRNAGMPTENAGMPTENAGKRLNHNWS